MTSPGPKAGDKVRVTFEGTVIGAEPFSNNGALGSLTINHPNGTRSQFARDSDENFNVEIIEAAYVDGGIYVDSDGEVLKYTVTGNGGLPGWRQTNHSTNTGWGFLCGGNYAKKPVIRLDGKDGS